MTEDARDSSSWSTHRALRPVDRIGDEEHGRLLAASVFFLHVDDEPANVMRPAIGPRFPSWGPCRAWEAMPTPRTSAPVGLAEGVQSGEQIERNRAQLRATETALER